MNRYFLLILSLFFAGPAAAETILMARSYESFEVVLEETRKSLEGHGYTIAHEQRCDGGLHDSGYKTDFYRVLFFGKPDEVRRLSKAYPELIPYLPLKMAVFAEGDQMLIVSFNPEEYALLFSQPELRIQFARWKSDIESVLAEMRANQP